MAKPSVIIFTKQRDNNPLITMFINLGYLWGFEINYVEVNSEFDKSKIRYSDYAFYIYDNCDSSFLELMYMIDNSKPILIFYNNDKHFKFNQAYTQKTGIKYIDEYDNFMCCRCSINKEFINDYFKIYNKFNLEYSPRCYVGKMKIDEKSNAICSTHLGKVIISNKNNIYNFAISSWQFGEKNIKLFFVLLASILKRHFINISFPRTMSVLRVDDWPYTTEMYLSKKKVSDIKRFNELMKFYKLSKKYNIKSNFMVNSHIIDKERNIHDIYEYYPKTTDLLKKMSEENIIKVNSHGAYHINLKKMYEGKNEPREFKDLTYEEAKSEILKNVSWIKEKFSVSPQGFVPPVWEYGENAKKAAMNTFKWIALSNYDLKNSNMKFIQLNTHPIEIYETIKYSPYLLNVYDKNWWQDNYLTGIPCILVTHSINGKSQIKSKLNYVLNCSYKLIILFFAISIIGLINKYLFIFMIVPLILIFSKFEYNLCAFLYYIKQLFYTDKQFFKLIKSSLYFEEIIDYFNGIFNGKGM